jgi:NADPH-dependent 2,4-dienoyl-CoA reductase/sulfur reductase-like enzyme
MKIIIVGGNHAGVAAALRIKEIYPEDEVILFEKRNEVTFVSQTIPLFLMGKQNLAKQANYITPKELIEKGISLHLNTEVLAIESQSKKVVYQKQGQRISEDMFYDRLIMATGSYPLLPPTGGKRNETLFLLKEREDAQAIAEFLTEAKSAVVIGGGLVGVEISRILNQKGIAVTVVEANPHLLMRYLDEKASIEVEAQLKREGIEILTGTKASSYQTAEKHILQKKRVTVKMIDGKKIQTDGVFISIGFRPSSHLLAGQVTLGDRGAIVVDQYMYTSDPDILAVGDCATTHLDLLEKDVYNPHASDALRQGLIAGINVHTRKQPISFTTGTYKFNMEGYTIASTGITLSQAIETGYDAAEVSYQNNYLADVQSSYYDHTGSIFLKNQKSDTPYIQLFCIYEKGTKKMLGLQVLGTIDVSQYTNIISLAISQGLTADDIEFTDFFYEHGYKDPIGFTKIIAKKIRENELEAMTDE